MSSDSQEVRRANLAFYRAFESLNAANMGEVWLHSARVQCTHPGWPRLVVSSNDISDRTRPAIRGGAP